MRRLIVGDIHGCYAELQDLLAAAGLSSGDEVIALGDILDRGPASPAVFDFFHQTPQARTLLGNHERKHVRAFRGDLAPALSQRITRWQFGEERYPAVCAALDHLPITIQLPEALLTHGFYEPGVPLESQREVVLIGTLSGEAYLERTYDRPWYELYDGDRPIVVGHSDYRRTGEPFVYAGRVYGVDTGCCRGGRLTGLLLPEFRFVSVPARADHWREIQAAYRAIDPPDLTGRAPEDLTWDELDRALAPRAAALLPTPQRQRLTTLRDRSAALLEEALTYTQRESARLLAGVRAAHPAAPSHVTEAGAFAAKLEDQPYAPDAALFHLARKGQLTNQRLRSYLKTPSALTAFTATIGLMSPTRSASTS
jgi:serine/threonine protein phosphatase 1